MSTENGHENVMSSMTVYAAPLRFLALAAIALLAPTALLSYFFYCGRGALDERLAQIRGAGEPTSMSELNTWYPAIAEADNATGPLERAHSIAQSPGGFMADYRDALENAASDDAKNALRTEIAKQLALRQDYFDALREASTRRGYRMPGQPVRAADWQTRIEGIGRLNYDERCLTIAAMYESDTGAADTSFRDLIAAIRFSNLLRVTPLPEFAKLGARTEMRRTAFRAVEFVLNRHNFTAAQLLALGEAVDQLEDTEGVYRATVESRCYYISSYRDYQSNAGYLSALNPIYLAGPWFAASALDSASLLSQTSRLPAAQRRSAFALLRRESTLGKAEGNFTIPVFGFSIFNPYPAPSSSDNDPASFFWLLS